VSSINRMFAESRNFFDLPEVEKLKCTNDHSDWGYTRYLGEIVNPESQACGDTKEGYYIVGVNETGDKNIWPESRPNFKTVMLEYHHECLTLSKLILHIISQAAGLDKTHFDPYFEVNPSAILRLLKYSTEPSDPDAGIYGTGPHCDYGMFTLLMVESQPGLQIFYRNMWVDVPPKRDHFIVNLGDCLQAWTNGFFKSTLHRVLTVSPEVRYSTAFFFEPSTDTIVCCLPEFVEPDIPVTYQPFKFGDYLRDKYLKTHAKSIGGVGY